MVSCMLVYAYYTENLSFCYSQLTAMMVYFFFYFRIYWFTLRYGPRAERAKQQGREKKQSKEEQTAQGATANQ